MNVYVLGQFAAPPELDASWLRANVRAEADPRESRIIEYLNGGTRIVYVPGVAYDLLGDPDKVVGAPHILTDGKWIWTLDIPYYVREYHLRIPEAMHGRMHELNWVCPLLSESDAQEVLKAFDRGTFDSVTE